MVCCTYEEYIEIMWIDDNRGKWTIVCECGTYFAIFYDFMQSLWRSRTTEWITANIMPSF